MIVANAYILDIRCFYLVCAYNEQLLKEDDLLVTVGIDRDSVGDVDSL